MKLSVPEQHQLKIARKTLTYNDETIAMFHALSKNSPTKEQAREIIARLTRKGLK